MADSAVEMAMSNSPRIKNAVQRAIYYWNAIFEEVGKHATTDNSDRSLLLTGYVKMIADDSIAIISLIERDNPGPAFKFVRILYEEMVHLVWVYRFGSDELVQKLLHTKHAKLPGTMRERAQKIDEIFVRPEDRETGLKFFEDLHDKLWSPACGYTHGGCLALNRALAGYDEESTYQVLRTSTTMFIFAMDGMYKLVHGKKNDVLWAIYEEYIKDKW